MKTYHHNILIIGNCRICDAFFEIILFRKMLYINLILQSFLTKEWMNLNRMGEDRGGGGGFEDLYVVVLFNSYASVCNRCFQYVVPRVLRKDSYIENVVY